MHRPCECHHAGAGLCNHLICLNATLLASAERSVNKIQHSIAVTIWFIEIYGERDATESRAKRRLRRCRPNAVNNTIDEHISYLSRLLLGNQQTRCVKDDTRNAIEIF